MKESWISKKKASKKRRNTDHYSFWDFVFDALLWIPELVMLPFRITFWMLRGIGKLVSNIF